MAINDLLQAVYYRIFSKGNKISNQFDRQKWRMAGGKEAYSFLIMKLLDNLAMSILKMVFYICGVDCIFFLCPFLDQSSVFLEF